MAGSSSRAEDALSIYSGHGALRGDATARAHNLCLPYLLDDDALARDLIQSWGALSHATHYHSYDLPPTAAELGRWLRPIERLLAFSSNVRE